MSEVNIRKRKVKIIKENTSNDTPEGMGNDCPKLQKFMLHFRRPSSYKGEYGFDWLRDEYIYPIETVEWSNDGRREINQPKELCLNPEALKIEYKETNVKNPISPYGEDYYPAWLAIFPSIEGGKLAYEFNMHSNGVDLDIEIEELESLEKNGTEILFECSNANIVITPPKLNLDDLLGAKKTKKLGTSDKRDYYLNSKKVNIKNINEGFANHEEIKVFAELNGKKEEVGKLMLYENSIIPTAKIVVVKVNTGGEDISLRADYKKLFKYQSLNQALVHVDIEEVEEFNIGKLPVNYDVIQFKKKYIHADQEIDYSSPAETFKKDLVALYERNHKLKYKIDGKNKSTYLFYTSISPVSNRGALPGSSTSIRYKEKGMFKIIWGNAFIIYKEGLVFRLTAIHESGHSFSLAHSFNSDSLHIFYRGYTDNIMDYPSKKNEKKEKDRVKKTKIRMKQEERLTSFFKWQWDEIRSDRSMVYGDSDDV